MGIKLDRKKPRLILMSLIYRISNILPFSNIAKFRLFLNLEWIFDRLSHEMSFRIYSDENHPVRIYSKTFILEFIEESFSVLDLGCKHGVLSNFIAAKAKKVVGIDFDEEAIKVARNKFQKNNLNFEVGEASEYLNKQTEKFDVLILSHILEHLENPRIFLLQFKEHFELIYIEVPDFDRYYLNHYRKDKKLNLIYSDNDHVHEFDRYELREIINDCKLQILKAEYIFGIQKIWTKVV